METKQYEEVEETGVAKVNIGIRGYPALKMELNDEAVERGLSMSEYGELLLSNRHESQQLKQSKSELQKEVERLTALVNTRQTEAVNAEINELKKKLEVQNSQPSILQDKRLLYIFENVKGQKDEVIDPFSDNFPIVYQKPEDLVLALIYSCTLNQ